MTAATWQGVSAAPETTVHCIGDLEFEQLTLDAWRPAQAVPASRSSPSLSAHPCMKRAATHDNEAESHEGPEEERAPVVTGTYASSSRLPSS
jgi:hypothetical protein